MDAGFYEWLLGAELGGVEGFDALVEAMAGLGPDEKGRYEAFIAALASIAGRMASLVEPGKREGVNDLLIVMGLILAHSTEKVVGFGPALDLFAKMVNDQKAVELVKQLEPVNELVA